MSITRKNRISVLTKLILISLLLSISFWETGKTQTQARADIIGIPPVLPSPYISDFEQNVFAGNYQVHLTIMGPGPVDVRFHVRVTLDNVVLVNETSLPATFDSGLNILSPFPNFVQFEATTREILEDLPGNRFRQAFQSGSFPEGNYQVTVEPEVVGSNIPGVEGIANFMVRYPQPPTLISPSNGQIVQETVSTPVFNWSPVMGPPGLTLEYEFLLVELFEGQNPADAIVSNREHASALSIGNTMLPYTTSYLPLEKGKTYAWQVTARDVNGEIPIKNEGRSEIFVFTYGSDEQEDELITDIPDVTLPTFDFDIPVTTITGSINWTFRPTEGAPGSQPSSSSESFFMGAINNSNVQYATDDPNYSMEGQNETSTPIFSDFVGDSEEDEDSEDQEFQNNAVVPVFGGGTTGGVEVQIFDPSSNNYQNQVNDVANLLITHPMEGANVKAIVTIDGNDHVIATTNADENGNYTLTFAPSELDRLLNQSDESESAGGSFSAFGQQQQNQNETINVEDANSPAAQVENMELAISSVQIVVDSPYFAFSEKKYVTVSSKSAKTYNAGTITGTALTYRLEPTVLERDDEDPISGATVEIFRPLDWYDVVPALKPEGWPLDLEDEGSQEMINGSMMVKVAEADSDRIITQLFPREKGAADRYVVRVSAEGYHPLVTTLSSSPKLSVNESVTIEKIYRLVEAPPMVTGRVVRRDNQAPLANIPVVLQATGGGPGNQISALLAQTDSDGRFTISNIPAREDPYKLVVSSPKISKYEEELLLNEKGMVVERDPLMVDPTLISVVGKVVNDEGVSVSNATVRWQDGGNPVQTDQYGRFVTANTAGTHVLQIRKIGHRDLDKTVTVELPDEDWRSDLLDDAQSSDNVANWAGTVMNSTSFQTEEEGEDTMFSFTDAGYYGNMSMEDAESDTYFTTDDIILDSDEMGGAYAYVQNLMGSEGSISSGGVHDIGRVIVERRVGKLDVTVESVSDSEPIPGATVEVGTAGLNGETGDDGSVYFGEAPAGTVPLRVVAPGTTNYVPVLTEVTVDDNGDVTYATVRLDLGGRAVGTVTAAGNPVEGATIRVEGRDDITTTTSGDGSYTLPGIPTGEWTLKATKSGFVGVSQTATFSEDEEQTVDFSLQDAGFDIASLMGFDIEVDELTTDSDTTISGAFVSIPSNDLLTVDSGLRIPFTDIRVYEDGGTLVAAGGEVQTDMSEFNAQIFNFLQVTITNPNGLIVRQRQLGSDIGYVAGTVEVDYASTFTGATGWEWPSAADQYLKLPNTDDLPDGLGEEELVTLTSDGSFPFPDIGVPDFELSFGSASETIDLFGFDVTLNLNESVLRNDGFHMQGDVTLAEIPLLDTATITLEEFWIGTDGAIREASLDLDPKPQIVLAAWAMELANGALSETGFSLGGSVEVDLPSSDPSEITFSDLSISPDQIFGGKFELPDQGLDLFGIVDLKSRPGTDIEFGKVQNEDVYFITGAAEFNLPSLVEDPLKFREFLVRTDGQFSASIVTDFETDFFGLADLTVNGVDFENIGTPSIYVDGQFGLRAIPFISAQAGGITYEPGGGVSVDEIDLDFDILNIAHIGVGIGFVNTDNRVGFTGRGELGIAGLPVGLDIGFNYERLNNQGLVFGVDIEAGIPPIALGSNVSLENVGGGFQFNSSNDEMAITLSGMITLAPGTGAVVALDPLEVTVTAGNGAPVIEGTTSLSIMTQQIANASLVIDLNKPVFSIETEAELSIPNVDLSGRSAFVLSGEPGNVYWMMGTQYQATLLDLFDANANVLAAVNLDVSENPQLSNYYEFVTNDPEDFFTTGNAITGLYLDVGVEMGVPPSNPKCVSTGKIELCAYYWNQSQCKIQADFATGNYGLLIGSEWAAGGDITYRDIDIAGASIEANATVSGGYSGYWHAYGEVGATVKGYIGNCGGGCQTKVCWGDCNPLQLQFECIPKGASVCLSGGIIVDYDQRRSNRLKISLDI